MDSFEDLGLTPPLVEALAAEGIDFPTPVQEQALPVLRRGNSLVLRAGPGAGVLVAYGAALLDRLETGAGAPRALVATPTREAADQLAESLARLAQATGHVVAALDHSWVLPERAHILFGTAPDLLDAVRHSRVKLEDVDALVVDGAAAIQGISGLEELATLAELLPGDSQRVVVSLPLTPAVEEFVGAHLRRAVHLPAGPGGDAEDDVPFRGEVHYRLVGAPKDQAILDTVARLLDAGARHTMLFCRSHDRAADVGDHLTLHGFLAGAPGDPELPVWLAADELEARKLLQNLEGSDRVATLSVDVPPGPDSLDRRHGAGGSSVILALAREIPHLKQIAREARYRAAPEPGEAAGGVPREVDRVRDRISKALEEEDLGPYHVLLEPLYERHSPGEVAAALAALLRKAPSARPAGEGGPEGPASGRRQAPSRRRRPASFVRLFVTVGERDGVGPGDLLGAVTGEAGIEGARVGKIEIRDTYSLVEVEEPVAQKVIKALNGVSIKGRSARVDYDRGPSGGRGRRGSR